MLKPKDVKKRGGQEGNKERNRRGKEESNVFTTEELHRL